MTGAVTRLAPATDVSVPEAPALGFSLQVDLGAGRVCTMQTFLANDCSKAELDAMLDKMTRAGDRQRAHYKIEELNLQLQREVDFISQAEYDIARIDGEHDKAQSARQDNVQKFQKQLDALMARARDEHVGSGRRGEFTLKGTTLSAHNAGKSAIDKLIVEIATAENERVNTHKNLGVTLEGHRTLKAKIEAEIADCKKIVGA